MAAKAVSRLPARPAWLRSMSTDKRLASPAVIVQTLRGRQHEVSSDGTSLNHKITGGLTASKRGLGLLSSTFLPFGYPESVEPNYLNYVRWQAIHHGAMSVNGVLASTFLLYGVGLGSTEAAATAGALNWALKDGLGQMGTLVFGKAIAQRFDINTKTWYILASVKLDLAIALEMCTAVFPGYFLILGAVANSIKGLAWMAGGSTRSAFNVSFTRHGNIADLTAKATSQTICTSLLGNMAGVALAAHVGQDFTKGVSISFFLSAVHIYSAYKSAECVSLRTLNPATLELLSDRYLHDCELYSPRDLVAHDPCLHIPTLTRDTRFLPRIVIGQPIHSLLDNRSWLLPVLLQVNKYDAFMLLPRKGKLHIVFRENATSQDMALAFLHAAVLRSDIRRQGFPKSDDPSGREALHAVLESAHTRAQAAGDEFVNRLKDQGWNMDRVQVESVHARATW